MFFIIFFFFAKEMASCGIIDRIRDLTQSEETDIKNLGMIFMETFEAKFSQ